MVQTAENAGTEAIRGVVNEPGRRHDFLWAFECTRGNPNGDFDMDNAPRQDPETGRGGASSVCLKHKVRAWVEEVASNTEDEARRKRLEIFIRHGGVLNEQIREAYEDEGLPTGKRVERVLPDGDVGGKIAELADEGSLPEGFVLSGAAGGGRRLSYSGELAPNELKAALDEVGWDGRAGRDARKVLEGMASDAGKPEKSRENVERARRRMLERKWDVRMFGGVMGTGLNAGQVRGPMQLVDAESVDPVTIVDMTLTRGAVTREEDRERTDRTIGNKKIIPYGLYLCRGFFTPKYARDTGVTPDDLALFWQALEMMWGIDRAHIRPSMSTVGLWVFSHDSPLGNAPDHKLFRRIRVRRKPEIEVAREATDHDYTVLAEDLPAGVTLTTLVEPPDENDH